MKHVGGIWTVGTKDNEVVYLSRTAEDGEFIFEANLTPSEAREVGEALIAKAKWLGKRGKR